MGGPTEVERQFYEALTPDQRRMLVEGEHMQLAASLTDEQKAIAASEVNGMQDRANGNVAVVLGLLTELIHVRMHPGCENPDQPREKVAQMLFDHTTEHMNQEEACTAMVRMAELLVAELIHRHGGIQEVLDLLETAADAVPDNTELFLERHPW